MIGDELTTVEIELLATAQNGVVNATTNYERELVRKLFQQNYLNVCGALTMRGWVALDNRDMRR